MALWWLNNMAKMGVLVSFEVPMMIISGKKHEGCGCIPQSTERQMRTTGLSSYVLYSCLCWSPSSCESSIGIPIEISILLRRARTKLDWEFATLYSVASSCAARSCTKACLLERSLHLSGTGAGCARQLLTEATYAARLELVQELTED